MPTSRRTCLGPGCRKASPWSRPFHSLHCAARYGNEAVQKAGLLWCRTHGVWYVGPWCEARHEIGG